MAFGDSPETTAHATDSVAGRVADLHALLGEGPAVLAVRDGRAVAAADLDTADSRRSWPLFAPAATAVGARAVLAVPMRVGDTGIGVFGLYSRSPGGLGAEQRAEAEAFAGIIVGLALDHVGRTDRNEAGQAAGTGGTGESDQDRWPGREAEVHQATGMVSVQLGVGLEESLIRLRAHAFAHGRPLSEIAHEVVTRRLRISPDVSDQPERHT